MTMAAAVAILLALGSTRLAAAEACATQLEDARSAYLRGDFAAVWTLADACLALQGTTAAERAAALELRAKARLGADDVDGAREAVVRLLRESPDFTGKAGEDPPQFIAIVRQMSRELRQGATSAVSKTNESLLDAPATVVVVTGEQIRLRGYADLEAVLRDLPGFDISRARGQSYSNIYQRGYRSEATNRTLLIVDGVEQNDLFSNVAYLSRQYPLSNIDRVEVVYGPASTMYGANAFLGVINVITKEPEDLLKETQAMGVDTQVAIGPWDTRAVDATVAGRYKNASFSLTGRAYKTDGWDGSSAWNFDRTSDAAFQRYEGALFGVFGGGDAGNVRYYVGQARFLDQRAFTDPQGLPVLLGGNPVGYSDLTRDWMLSGKAKVKDLLFGFQTWRLEEGTAAAGTSRAVPGALNGNIWRPYQTAFYVKYSAPISGALTFSYFGQGKMHGVGDGSAQFGLQGYLDGPLEGYFGANDVSNESGTVYNPETALYGTPAFWTKTLLRESSRQVRNEIDLVYRPGEWLNIVGGVDLRNGSIQTNYVKASDCDPVTGDSEKFQARILSLLGGQASPRCNPTGQPAAFKITLVPDGGNHYSVRDVGFFGQASYKLRPDTKLVAGWRVDNNAIDPYGGTGTVGTPRLGVVHTRGPYVFKAVYSEAFKAPSSEEQFSDVEPIRSAAREPLKPERARNIELSLGRQVKRVSIDVSVYRAAYTDAIALVNRNLIGERSVNDFLATYAASNYETPPDMSKVEGLAQKLLHDALFSSRYENIGGFTVWGVQAAASGRIGTVDVFANYNYTNPKASGNLESYISLDDARQRIEQARIDRRVSPFVSAPSSLRVGDIANHRFSVGAANRWDRFETSVRTNFVGPRPTGVGTTVSGNPLTVIDAHTIVNGSIGYRLWPGVTAQLTVDNLFDVQYEDPGIGTADGVRFASKVPQPGRALFLRLLTRF